MNSDKKSAPLVNLRYWGVVMFTWNSTKGTRFSCHPKSEVGLSDEDLDGLEDKEHRLNKYPCDGGVFISFFSKIVSGEIYFLYCCLAGKIPQLYSYSNWS